MTNQSNAPQNPTNPSGDGPPTPPIVPTGSRIPRQILSSALLQGDREIQIVHGEEVYRLSLTRQGKLILHK